MFQIQEGSKRYLHYLKLISDCWEVYESQSHYIPSSIKTNVKKTSWDNIVISLTH